MTSVEKTFVVDKDISTVFHTLYEENREIFESEVRIVEWKKTDWKMNNKDMTRKEEVYVYIEDLPEEVVGYTTEANKHIRFGVKNQVLINTMGYKKIKTRFKILNLNIFLRTIVNDLQIIKIKNNVEMFKRTSFILFLIFYFGYIQISGIT